MFELERFIEDCREVAGGADSRQAIAALLEREVSRPTDVIAALGEPTRAGVQALHVSDDLSLFNVVWGPYMTIMPHDHEMWAVIGVYTGREDNIFWRRVDEDGAPATPATKGRGSRVKAAGARNLGVKDVEMLGPDAIHSVTNPIPRLTGAIHIYGGDLFHTPRSEWDPETLVEGAYDVARNAALFEASNRWLEDA